MSFFSCREKAGLTQVDAAKKLGLTRAAICLWETGKTFPRASILPKVAKLYRCKVDDLLKGNPGKQDPAQQRTEDT